MKNTRNLFLSLATASFLTSCASAFMDVKAGSGKVAIAEASQVAHCESKGKVNSSVLSKVWFANRSSEAVEENLLQMARNAAVEEGANTIVKGESKQFGERTFQLYQCK